MKFQTYTYTCAKRRWWSKKIPLSLTSFSWSETSFVAATKPRYSSPPTGVPTSDYNKALNIISGVYKFMCYRSYSLFHRNWDLFTHHHAVLELDFGPTCSGRTIFCQVFPEWLTLLWCGGVWRERGQVTLLQESGILRGVIYTNNAQSVLAGHVIPTWRPIRRTTVIIGTYMSKNTSNVSNMRRLRWRTREESCWKIYKVCGVLLLKCKQAHDSNMVAHPKNNSDSRYINITRRASTFKMVGWLAWDLE